MPRPRDADDWYAATHDEIAEAMGISRTRVQQLEANALRKLRKGLGLSGSGVQGTPAKRPS